MAQEDEQQIIYESTWGCEAIVEPTVAIIRAVADVEDVDPTSLPPLNEYIDTNALDRLVSPNTDGGANQIIFRYYEYEIFIDHTGIQLQRAAVAGST